MATFLYRLGRLSFRRRRLMTLLWVLVVAAAGTGAATLSTGMSTSFSLPGTESQRALTLLSERLPGSGADGASARVVFVAPAGGTVTGQAGAAAIGTAVTKLKALPHVASVADPFVAKTISRDQRTAFATVTYAVIATDLTTADQDALIAAGRSASTGGLTVEFGGDAVQEKIGGGATEGLGVLVAAVVLVITFGSLLAAGLPLLTALVGVGLGLCGILVATRFVDLSSTTLTLAVMLGLAVGIDYALFIVSRYRHELLVGRSGEEAAGRAVGTAGSAVVFAGATVVIALAALTVAGIPFLTAMGLSAAATVALAVVIALTLLPALLGFLGPRVLGRRGASSRDTEADGGATTMGERWVRGVVRRPWVAVVLVLAGLGAAAIPAADLQLAMPSDATASPTTTQRKAYDAVAAGFGPGFNGPLVIVADLQGVPAAGRAAAVKAVQTDLPAVPGVAYVTPATTSPAGDTAIYTVVPTTGPLDKATETLVKNVRAKAAGWHAATGASVYVTGTTAVGIDISDKLSGALVPYLAVVVGLAFVLLTLVFRSVLVPLKATLGFLLSVAATFGAVVAVFEWGHLAGLIGVDTIGPVISFLPIFLVGILFGLAMDYEVFLVTRMREEHVHGAPAQEAVVQGFRHGARVVTAAAVIMFSVFAGFVLSGETVIVSMGFALAFGILVDAFFVRMTLVPAVMSLLGNAAWWLPKWLDRVLPDVDVEGEKLTRMLDAGPAAPAPAEAAPAPEGHGRPPADIAH